MPQNHVQNHAQNHGRVRPLKNKAQIFFAGALPQTQCVTICGKNITHTQKTNMLSTQTIMEKPIHERCPVGGQGYLALKMSETRCFQAETLGYESVMHMVLFHDDLKG